ncbi:MAG: nitronate monooxygenase [Paracoccaceae bacterium]|nr:nitronate monooxygenase [Paracoccaceae bacterium]
MSLPILQAPMAGAGDHRLALAVAGAGGLGALPCAMLTPDRIRAEVAAFRAQSDKPLNLNFFCHAAPELDADGLAAWQQRLAPYYREQGLDPATPAPLSNRAPFDATLCALVEELRPEVVSFHFGLPASDLFDRVKATGARVLASATTVAEAVWLDSRGCDAIIAQGAEAGGHRGMFLTEDVATQIGTLSLVPQVVDAVRCPVIAAGGIADGRGIAAAFMLGAAAVQVGTAYLFCPEATISPPHRKALAEGHARETALTNVFTGRPARGMVNRVMREQGFMSDAAPAFPLAGGALAPLRAATEPAGSGDFMPLWSGQSAGLCRAASAADLTRALAADAKALLARQTM